MRHKKIVTIGIILLAISFIVIALSNSTYALFSNDAYGANTNAYTTGMLSIEASSKSETISLTNALPITDEEGLKTNPYVFTVKNIGNLDYLFDIKLLSSGDDSSTIFSPQYIKLQIDDGEVVTLSSLTNGKIKSNVTLFAGDSIDVSIRIWLSIDTPNSEIGKTFNSKIVADGQAVYTSSNNELKLNGAQYITSLYNSAVKTEVTNNNIVYNQAQSVSLMNDRLGGTTEGYDSGNVRYYGASPNNYIYFNCKDYHRQNDETCEKWRIIGVFDGKLKLIRWSIGDYTWDYNSDGSFDNNWTDSTLNKLLNNTYYNSGTTTYYNGTTTGISVDFSTNGITSATRANNLISESTWHINKMYGIEKYSNDVYNNEREGVDVWTGNIGLAYPSDYAYAADFIRCKNTINNYGLNDCVEVNWLTNEFRTDGWYWLINPYLNATSAVWSINQGSVYDGSGVNGTFSVVPVLYLNSDVAFNSKGNGSFNEPYQIYVEPYPSVVEYITSLYTKGNPTLITQTSSNDSYYYSYQDDTSTWGLMNDGLKVADTIGTGSVEITDSSKLMSGQEGNIRYFGPSDSVNNYVYFNCNSYDSQSDSTCEKWRIIGIVDGKVKIIKEDIIGKLAWDQDKNEDSSKTTYKNNWETSSLQLFLNGLYYDRGTLGTYGYLSGSTGTTVTTLNLEAIGIKESTREMISDSTWYLGGYDKADGLYPSDVYNFERTNKVGTTIRNGNAFKINAKIGLMNASDYGYSANLLKCSSDFFNYNSTSTTSTQCRETSWLKGNTEWLLNNKSSSSGSVWNLTTKGEIAYGGPVYSDARSVRPVLYLNNNVFISGGDGTSNSPYKFFIE